MSLEDSPNLIVKVVRPDLSRNWFLITSKDQLVSLMVENPNRKLRKAMEGQSKNFFYTNPDSPSDIKRLSSWQDW